MQYINRRKALTAMATATAVAVTGAQATQATEQPISPELRDLVTTLRIAINRQRKLGSESAAAENAASELFQTEGIDLVPVGKVADLPTSEILSAIKRKDLKLIGANSYAEYHLRNEILENANASKNRIVAQMTGIVADSDLELIKESMNRATRRTQEIKEAIEAHNSELYERSGYMKANARWEAAIETEDKARIALLKYFPVNGAEARLKIQESVTTLSTSDDITCYPGFIEALIEGSVPPVGV